MKYAMLKNEDTGEIKLVDNSTKLGKGKVEKLCNEGYVGAGTIETDLGLGKLLSGIAYQRIKEADAMREAIMKAGVALGFTEEYQDQEQVE